MTATNHAVTGALVVVSIHNPYIGLPAAFVSHFVIDVIPHWNHQLPFGSISRKLLIAADVTLAVILMIVLALTVQAPTLLILTGGFAGVAPDFMWLPELLFENDVPMDKKTPLHHIRRWHHGIQKSETPKGLYIEFAWLLITLALIYRIHY